MFEDRIQAFADDFNVITVYVSKKFYEGNTGFFYLRDPHGIKHELLIEKVENEADAKKYILKLPGLKLVPGIVYEIVEEHGLAAEVHYRYIVQTAEFQEKYFNDREDFGATVSGGVTLFVLWAPTASSVHIVINPLGEKRTYPLKRVERGAWQIRIAENLHGQDYRYVLRVNGALVETLDPYAYGSVANAKASSVIDFKQIDMNFFDERVPAIKSYTDAIIFETNVRDFSSDENNNISQKMKYLGMIEKGAVNSDGKPVGFDYIKAHGATHIQIMPVNDFASVDEFFQREIYNWGYDPVQYNALEGSYSTSLNDPLSRVIEFSKLVSGYHEQGMGIILDVVYNHMANIGTSPFEHTVPFYYFRRSSSGEISNGSFCGNDLDSEKPMLRKFIIDSVLHFVRHYHVDGFRFDLMGILDIETMNEVAGRLRSEKANIIIYGEGWDMPTFLADEKKTAIKNAHMTQNIAFFNDYYRDNTKGPTSPDKVYEKGYGLGSSLHKDAFKAALTGNTIEIFGSKMFSSPEMSLNYVEAHDNMTLWDKIEASCKGESVEMMKARQKFLNGTLCLSQGICFFHMGQEFCRTKQGIDNSYMSPDSINRIDYERAYRFEDVVSYTRDMIKLRKSLPVFRFKTAEEIDRHIFFEERKEGIIIMKLRNISEYCKYEEITVYFNPFDLTQEIDLGEKHEILADCEGLKKGELSKFTLRPISITVLAKAIN